MPKVSIIMPTYNVEKYIDEAVESVLNQTYQDFELIIVDDCSNDETYEKLVEHSTKDKRIVLYRNDENMKICYSLNKCLSHCKGEYILRMDGDDISLPNRIEVMVRYLDEHPNISLVGSQTITIDEEGNEVGYRKYLRTSSFIEKGNKFCPCVVHIWMARKNMYVALNGYNDVPYVEDYDFLLRGTINGYKYANCADYLYKIRIREGNTASSKGLQQKKAVEYIKRIYFVEKKEVNIDEFRTYIDCNEKESLKYLEASKTLSEAITERKSRTRKICKTFAAVLKSKHIRKYLLGASYIRFLMRIENLVCRPTC